MIVVYILGVLCVVIATARWLHWVWKLTEHMPPRQYTIHRKPLGPYPDECEEVR